MVADWKAVRLAPVEQEPIVLLRWPRWILRALNYTAANLLEVCKPSAQPENLPTWEDPWSAFQRDWREERW